MQAVMKKAVRVGRTTMLAIGVGVVLALVLGLATVALAAVPGDPFKLGQVNVINNATTTLQGNGKPSGFGPARPLVEVKRDGSTSGPALRVENASTNGIQGAGIQIQVPQNRPPLSVNPDAGTATSLSADKLDGKDQEDFLSASRIYGVTQLKEGTGGDVPFSLGCDAGDVAISGGGNATDDNDALNSLFPASAGSYLIEFQDNAPTGEDSKFRGLIFCSDSSKPFRDL